MHSTTLRSSSGPLSSRQRWWLWGGAAVLLLGLSGCGGKPGLVQVQAPATAAAQDLMHRLAYTRLQLAALHLEEGRAQIALEEVARALQANPRYTDAYNLQGWVYASLQDYPSAQKSFEQALGLKPGDADSLYNLAWVQCQQKQFAVADSGFDAALAARGSGAVSLAQVWLGKGVCLQQAGQSETAVHALEKAHELDAANPVVAYNFAHALYKQGRAQRARIVVQRVNNSQWASAASLWLGIQVERRFGARLAVQQLADQLHKRFPDSREWQWFESGAFDD